MGLFKMIPDFAASPFFIAAVVLAILGLILVFAGIAALFRLHPIRFTLRTLAGLLLVALGALAGTISIGIQDYQALTHEALAAHIDVRPQVPQRFQATLRYPDGREDTFQLAGDEIYVDAHILKWKPVANMLGLHTAYELDRVAGRYRDIGQERTAQRTVYQLSEERLVDLFGLRRRYEFLSALLDAEYGSATFVPVSKPVELELRVSTSGLLIREVSPSKASPKY
jgi:hypothetical protein